MTSTPNFNDVRYPDPDPLTFLLKDGDRMLAAMREMETDAEGWIWCADLSDRLGGWPEADMDEVARMLEERGLINYCVNPQYGFLEKVRLTDKGLRKD